MVGKFLTTLNDTKLTPEARASALIGHYAEMVNKITDDNVKAWVDLNAQWQTDLIKQHTEPVLQQKVAKIGGMIEAYSKDMGEAYKARSPGMPIPDFGKSLREAATLTGSGNNPAIFNFMSWMADQLGEGTPLSGQPAGGEQSAAKKLFPNQK